MLTWIKTDLHVHTCLSPCADLTMSPRKIVGAAVQRGLGIIAITDHNSAGNVQAVIQAAKGSSVTVLPGMEICTQEEVHVLALFRTPASALAMQALVLANLAGTNEPDVFGIQVIANELDEVEGFEAQLLIGATALSLGEVVDAIHGLDGLAVASHIDRERNGVIGQLGFIPETVPFDAVEISRRLGREEEGALFQGGRRFPVIWNSDAHTLDRLGSERTELLLGAPTLPEIRKALRQEEGRRLGMFSE
jgi:3',5'-nucleoside bisphosphate phosphatase